MSSKFKSVNHSSVLLHRIERALDSRRLLKHSYKSLDRNASTISPYNRVLLRGPSGYPLRLRRYSIELSDEG